MHQFEKNFESAFSQAYVWRPELMDASLAKTWKRIKELIEHDKIWRITDTIHAQIRDYVCATHPQNSSDYDRTPIQHLLAQLDWMQTVDEFGTWVYYPWSGNLVHTLPAEEFNRLRLDRNRPKLTQEEQDKLKQLTIGIVGLSVGNAVTLTLLMEGIGGHLKLADPDSLDLSNMNRLRAQVHDIGVPKTVLAARQIFEINPYAELSLFHEGINEDNIEEFFSDEKLDVIIDECDDIYLKILLREKARSLGIPVLMETSDRGMLDIERFDLEPQRELFHGLVPGLSSKTIPKNLTVNEKVNYVLTLLGSETMSTRAAASMMELSNTISSWPQLASDVTLGGASVCTAVRKLGLNEPLPSGRRYVDLEQIILGDYRVNDIDMIPEKAFSNIKNDNADRQDLESLPAIIRHLVEQAIKAPTAGNMQQWRFHYFEQHLWVRLDMERAESTLDFQQRAAFLGIGAAIENIILAASEKSCSLEINWFPIKQDPTIVAKIKIDENKKTQGIDTLVHHIDERKTNRQPVKPEAISEGQIKTLKKIAKDLDCELQVATEQEQREQLAHLIGIGDQIRFLCPDLHREMMSELRWNERHADTTKDGVDVATLEMPASQIMVLKILARPSVAGFLRTIKAGKAIATMTEVAVKTYPAICMLNTEGNHALDFVRAGRAMQRIWLQATAFKIALQPRAVLTYMFDMANDAESHSFSA
ncbi:MAG: Rv1355c family protein, partial [Gammaproteobacteria bacterium]|nr:Rv1355c family protein [Gammaproteobacteria bacterium]